MPIERPTFTKTLVRAGYGRAQVDAAVDRIISSLSGPAPSLRPTDVSELSFPTGMYQPGYDMGEVDSWLDEVQVALGGQVAERPPVEPAPEPEHPRSAQTRNDWMLALTFITITLVVTVLLYVSRF